MSPLTSANSLLFPTATSTFGGCARVRCCTTIDLPRSDVRKARSDMRQNFLKRAPDGDTGSTTRPSRPRPPTARRFHREGGAAAVEFALVVPLLVIFLFGIIGFGVAFMQMQTIRGALREGGRAAATGASTDEVQDHAYDSALGAIDSPGNVNVNPNTGGNPVCTAQRIGDDTTVSYDTSNLPGGGIQVTIPFIPILLTPTLEANFRCEV
jgi:hypothetical protein